MINHNIDQKSKNNDPQDIKCLQMKNYKCNNNNHKFNQQFKIKTLYRLSK